VPAPPAAIANNACWPAALDSDGTSLPGRSFSVTASAVYPMVQATEMSSIHSHNRVLSSLRNPAATRRVMTGRQPGAVYLPPP
jgi:hypothetical protein